MVSPARLIAFEVLLLVESGGYASDLLLSKSAKLDGRDAGLASEIVYGCLRRQAQLDFLIQHFSGRTTKLDSEVRIALRMGIYQLRYLNRVPTHAAVGESVELVKRAKKASAAGFVNAVLRKAISGEVAFTDRATALSTPAWLLAEWDRQFGSETANRIAEAFLEKPEIYVRSAVPRAGMEPTDVPGCYRVTSLPADFRAMDIGSQTIVPLLDLQPGQTFLDLCAAPGNKTAQAIESGVKAIACDIHLHRATEIGVCPAVVLDARRPLPFRTRFDRILVDAPCSGTGTLGRNPEIRWRISKEDLQDLHKRQVAILSQAVDALPPGGRLVYSTCSLETTENESVVREVLAAKAGRTLVLERRRTPGVDPGDGFYAAVIA